MSAVRNSALAGILYDFYRQHQKNQVQRLRYELEAKNRLHTFGSMAGIFIEDGVSAKDTKRPALQRMLSAIEAGEVNLVMVTEFSRLSRNMRDFAAMWELFKSVV